MAEYKYRWMLKNYPNTFYIKADEDFAVPCEITRYIKSGTRWKETETKTVTASNIYYCNVVDAVPLFRSLGREIVHMKYVSKYGKVPYKIFSISPDGMERVVREFKF